MKKWLFATPFLISLASILHLWAKNSDETDLGVVLPWLGITVFAAGVFLGVSWLALRDAHRAIAVSSLLTALAMVYGHASAALLRKAWVADVRTAHAIVGALWLPLAVGGIFLLIRTRRDLTRGLAATAVFAATVCVFTVLRWDSRKPDPRAAEAVALVARTRELLEAPLPATRAPESPPDIYYIILDGYARADVLRAHFGHDNEGFLDALRARGFLVADRSRANYAITFLSLASSLSMTPLDGFARELGPKSSERLPFVQLTRGNRVSRFLKAQGYRYATILTNYYATESSETADVTYGYLPLLLRSEFAQAYLRTSVACLWEPSLAAAHQHSFRSIGEAAELEGPTFLFAHLIMPHPPYVFERDGKVRKDVPLSFQWREANSPDAGYVDQLVYLNARILEIVDRILKSSATPPVIILQGDHGWAGPLNSTEEDLADPRRFALQRMPILNAYLVPEGARRRLYPDITPVNTFRVLLSELFGADLPPVPDRSFLSTYAHACDMTDVTDDVTRAWAVEKR